MREKRPRYTEFLPEAQAISEARHSPLASLLVLVIGAFFVVALLWAALAEVDQAVVAEGQVRPGGRVKLINHPEGGAVAEILVRDGERVAAGEPLIRLDSELIEAEVRRLRGDLQALEAETARLEAEAGGAPTIDFPASVAGARPDLVATHTRLHEARHASLDARREAADREIEQRQSEVNALIVRIGTLGQSRDVLADQVRSLRTLADKGHFPFLRFQTVQRQLAETEGQLAETREQLVSSRAALKAASARRREIDDEARSTVLAELTEARNGRDRTAAALTQAEARLARTTILSPADGFVQNLAVNNPGQAVRANEPLMSIVPEADNLIVEARVANRDIGSISTGQRALVKVDTFDFIRFGALEGRVERIARDANTDRESGQVFYLVEIRTERSYLGDTPGRNKVQPGMQVEAELQTGSRSVLSYVTDRIVGTADEAFRER